MSFSAGLGVLYAHSSFDQTVFAFYFYFILFKVLAVATHTHMYKNMNTFGKCLY